MTNIQILKVLNNERICINRQVEGCCDRQCQLCDLRLEDKDILEVYDYLIEEYSKKLKHESDSGFNEDYPFTPPKDSIAQKMDDGELPKLFNK